PIRVLTLGNQKSVDLLLRPAAQPKLPPDPTAFTVECGPLSFQVALEGSTAVLTGLGSKIVLPKVAAPVGKKFSDGAARLTVVGEAVYFQRPARAYRDCRVRPPSN